MYSDAVTVRSVMPAVNAFNIPDLMHFPLRELGSMRDYQLAPASLYSSYPSDRHSSRR